LGGVADRVSHRTLLCALIVKKEEEDFSSADQELDLLYATAMEFA
jgi:hypothetical protein